MKIVNNFLDMMGFENTQDFLGISLNPKILGLVSISFGTIASQGTGNSYFAGNVGIGITSPLNPLSIESDSSPLIKIRNTTNGGGAAIEFNDRASSAADQNGRIKYVHTDVASQGGGSSFILEGEDDQTLQVLNNGRIVVQKTGSSAEVGYGFYNDVNTGMYSPGADTVALATAGDTRLYINSSGDVGIGTTSPSSKLQVFGDLTVGDDGLVGSWINVIAAGSGQDAGIRFGGESNTDSKAAIYTNTSNSDLHFDVTETTRMLIDSATGNVGIGTTSPGAKLEVEQSNSSTNTVFLSNSFNNKGFRTGNAGYATFAGYQDSNNTTSGSAYGSLIGLNTFYDGTNFYNDNQYIDPSSVLFKDGNIIFHTNDISATGNFTPNERLRISKTGNVGIGTTSPAYKLDVSGTGRFTGDVTATNFVLSSDKSLKTNIEDINSEEYVNVNWKTFELKENKGQKRYGVIAQELEETNPEFVRTNDEGVKSVAYIDLLIAKIAELEARLEKAGL